MYCPCPLSLYCRSSMRWWKLLYAFWAGKWASTCYKCWTGCTFSTEKNPKRPVKIPFSSMKVQIISKVISYLHFASAIWNDGENNKVKLWMTPSTGHAITLAIQKINAVWQVFTKNTPIETMLCAMVLCMNFDHGTFFLVVLLNYFNWIKLYY